MRTAKLFKHGKSQAVQLPDDFQFTGDEVLIKRAGDAVVLLSKENPWDALVNSLGEFTSDFMEAREQPAKND